MDIINTHRCCTVMSVSFPHPGFRFSERMDRFLA